MAASFRFRLKTLFIAILLIAALLWLLEVSPFLHDNLVVRFERIGISPLLIADPIEVVENEAIVFYRQHKLLPWKQNIHAIVLVRGNNAVRPRPTVFAVRNKLESDFKVVDGKFLQFTRTRESPYLGQQHADIRVERCSEGRLYECTSEASQRWVRDQILGRVVLARRDLDVFAIDCSYMEIEQFFHSSPNLLWTGEAIVDAVGK